MDDQELKDLIDKAQADGRISCKAALELAKTAGVSPARVGKMLNDIGIKIFACSLGCFK
ncbi:MAG: hypothetical protein AB1646_15085 [Thermodesulfobacteriota bacterium]